MKKSVLTFGLMGFAFLAHAQNHHLNENKLPGNSVLPSSVASLQKIAQSETGHYTYSVKDYFKQPQKSFFDLSPDGKYLSYVHGDGIYIQKLKTGETKKLIKVKNQVITDYFWGNNQTILFLSYHGGDENEHLYAININGSGRSNLTPFKGTKAARVFTFPEHRDFVIVLLNKRNKKFFEPYKISLKDGKIARLYKIEDTSRPISNYIFDKKGHLRAYINQIGGIKQELYYRSSKKSPFEKILSTDWTHDFTFLSFNYQSKNPNDAYVLTNLNSDKSKIVLYDFKQKKVLKEIYANDTFDVDGFHTSRKRNYEVDYFTYYGEKKQMVPVSETFKKLYKKFEEKFKNYDFSIVSTTDKENRYLIRVSSDRLDGKYYLYNSKKDTFTVLADLMPWLKEKDMAEIRPIQFKSRDGLTLYGYLTLPKEVVEGKKVPLIVNPHGGPYGARDHWGFNPETQLFASRGYATLQVNYRGSGGYGRNFYLAGNRQIGRKMLDDLEDGIKYVKTLDIINPQKIAIYGMSYGGLAALGSLVKTPRLYRCAVDYCGVSNLFTIFKSTPSYWNLRKDYEQWYDPKKDQDIMKQVSPALNVDKIIRPLLVIQGANDPRVNINQSDQVVEKLRKKGLEIPYMVKYNEGHGFLLEKNRIALYKVMMGFFSKYLKN